MGLKPLDAHLPAVRVTNGKIMDSRDRQAIAGSAAVIGNPASGPVGRAPVHQGWQREAWNYYDAVGELWHSSNFVGLCFSRIRLRPGYIQDDDSVGPIYDDDGQELVDDAQLAAELIRKLKAPNGGQKQLLSSIGKNISVAGEFYLLGADRLDSRGQVVDRSWEALSVDELKPKQDGTKGYLRFRGPGFPPEEVPADVYPLRVWNPHPRFSGAADSAIRPQLDILEELVLLTRQVKSQVISRLTQAGVYWVPEEISFPADPTAPGGEEEEDPFTADLIEVAAAAISDRGSAAAAVPMVVRAPAEFIKAVVHHTFQAPDDALSVTKRTEAVQRFAQGVDLPVEVTTGHQQTTFANAAQIDIATFRIYIEPKLELVLDALTAGYLRPQMMAARGLDPWAEMPDDIARMCVWYDSSELVLPPDRTKDAVEAHDRFTLSNSAFNRELGFSEDDMPDEEELARRIRIKQLVNVKETIRADETGAEGVSLLDPHVQDPANQPGEPNRSPKVVGSAAPSDGDRGLEHLRLRLAVAVEVFVLKAVERAGAKLKGRVPQSEASGTLKALPVAEVAAHLGPDRCATLAGSIDALLDGEFKPLHRMATMWCREAGRTDAEALALQVVQVAEELARRRLFDPAVEVDWPTILELTEARP